MNSSKIKIGVTDRGDAGWDLGWADKLGIVDGAIIITKHLSPGCLDKLLSAYDNGYKLILHCGCTGWGGTKIEPGAPSYQEQFQRLVSLIDQGFPIENCVLRIDPIFPTPNGLRRVEAVLAGADRLGMLDISGFSRERFGISDRKSRSLTRSSRSLLLHTGQEACFRNGPLPDSLPGVSRQHTPKPKNTPLG